MGLVSWEYYSSLHNKVAQTDFTAEEAKAEKQVRTVIGPLRWADIEAAIDSGEFTAEDFRHDQLLECICCVMDYDVSTRDKLGMGVSSASNDGYSETYAGDLVKQSDASEELARNIRRWLSGTGLVGAY